MTKPVPEGEITALLARWQNGNSAALGRLSVLVEPDLRQMAGRLFAGERRNHTLQPTALINEAFLRLLKQRRLRFENRTHFFAIAARLMRRVLVDHARRRGATKRGGDATLVSWAEIEQPSTKSSVDLLALESALSTLEDLSSRQGRVVELRFFGGLTIQETAQVLGVSPATIKVDWSMARAFLFRELGGA